MGLSEGSPWCSCSWCFVFVEARSLWPHTSILHKWLRRRTLSIDSIFECLPCARCQVRHSGRGTCGLPFSSSLSLKSCRGQQLKNIGFNVPSAACAVNVRNPSEEAWGSGWGLKGPSLFPETQTVWSLISHIRGQKMKQMREPRRRKERELGGQTSSRPFIPATRRETFTRRNFEHAVTSSLSEQGLVMPGIFSAEQPHNPAWGTRRGDTREADLEKVASREIPEGWECFQMHA